jgi:UDP-2-acetamido-3-amino-2,3-dideoxy-glucuronate N-acetyltransferase
MVNVACVGAGYWGRNLVRNFHQLGALGWVCDADRGRLNAVSATCPAARVTDTFEDVIRASEVNAVAIATPASTHGELVRRALQAGKDVFVEKPLCLDVEQARELVALASDRGRILMVGHLLWYHPAVIKLRDLVDAGELGRIQYIYSNRLNLGRIRREESILWSFAPHDISLILGLLGEMPQSITIQGGNYLHEQLADVTVTLLTFPSGVRAHVFVSWLHPFKEQKLVVVGTRKMAVFNDLETDDKLLLYPHRIEWKGQVPCPNRAEAERVTVESAEPLQAECAHFLECVETRRTPRTDGREATRVLTVLDACDRRLRDIPAPLKTLEPARPAGERPAGERPYFAHESSYIDDGVQIGDSCTIWHFSHILKGTRIGRNARIGQNVVIGPNVTVGDGVKIQNNVSVYEGVTLEDHVFCGPSVVFTNVINPRSEIRRMDELRPTLIRRGASLGANSTIVCGVTIGEYAFVGAGAVVVRDVPAHALVVGNPARIIGWMCECGRRVNFDDKDDAGTCSGCQRRYRHVEDSVCRA